MIAEQQESSSEKETGRLEAFSDGVFAVAITLLVFNLMNIPQPPPGKSFSNLDLAIMLSHQWPAYITFCISFATILIMWVNHHGMFKLIHKSDTFFMFTNGFLLLLTTIVPFPTALVATYLREPAAGAACAVYCGLFFLITIAYNLLWQVASQQHRLLKSNVSVKQVKKLTRNYALGFPGYLIALLFALWLPAVSIGICSILWLLWALTMYERKPAQPFYTTENTIQ